MSYEESYHDELLYDKLSCDEFTRHMFFLVHKIRILFSKCSLYLSAIINLP